MVRRGTVSISIYGLKRGMDRVGTLYLQSLEESRVVGVFLEAETRHCRIKINCQRLFAIQIPISEEGEGCWERGVCVKSNDICSACFFPLGDLTMTHIFQVFVSGLSYGLKILCYNKKVEMIFEEFMRSLSFL